MKRAALVLISLLACICFASSSSVPAGLPSTFQIGMSNIGTPITFPGIGFYYQYLVGDVYTASANWYSWQDTALPPGQFVVDFINNAQANQMVPVFTYYTIVQTSPAEDSGTGSRGKLSDPNFVRAYLGNLETFFIKARSSSPVVFHFEPDLLGYFQQLTNGDPSQIAVALTASGFPGVGSFPNDLRGLIQALDYLRSKAGATNVIFAIHCSVWGTKTDIQQQKPDDATVVALAQSSSNWLLAVDPNRFFALVFFEFSDRDSAFYRANEANGVPCSPNSADPDCRRFWWSDSDFTRNILYVQNVLNNVNLRGVFWQVPFGNMQMRAMNNQPFHYQDNKVEWFLGSNDNGNMDRYNQIGVIAILYGSGLRECSSITDTAGDGVTNPGPINGNVIENAATSADDGGYFAWRAANYSARGYLPLAAVGASAAPVYQASPSSPGALPSPPAPPPTGTVTRATLPVFTAGSLINSWALSWSWAPWTLSGGASLTPGAGSITYTPNNYNALYFTCTPSGDACFDGDYHSIYFQVYGGATGGKFRIQLASPGAGNSGTILYFTANPGVWTPFTFKLSDFGATSSNRYFGFAVQDDGNVGAGETYFDAIYIIGYNAEGTVSFPASKKRSLSTSDKQILAALWSVDSARLLPTSNVHSNKRQAAGGADIVTVMGISSIESQVIQNTAQWVPAYNAKTGSSLNAADVVVTVSAISGGTAATAGGLSGGAIAGIVVGSVVGGVLLIAIVGGLIVGAVVVARKMVKGSNERALDEEEGSAAELEVQEGESTQDARKPKKGVNIIPGRRASKFKSITARAPSFLLPRKETSTTTTQT